MIKSFWPKKPYASWVKDTTTASWKSPIGDAPALTAEQDFTKRLQLMKIHLLLMLGIMMWNESGQSWDLTDSISIN